MNKVPNISATCLTMKHCDRVVMRILYCAITHQIIFKCVHVCVFTIWSCGTQFMNYNTDNLKNFFSILFITTRTIKSPKSPSKEKKYTSTYTMTSDRSHRSHTHSFIWPGWWQPNWWCSYTQKGLALALSKKECYLSDQTQAYVSNVRWSSEG